MPIVVNEFVTHAVPEEDLERPQQLEQRCCLFRQPIPPDQLNPQAWHCPYSVPYAILTVSQRDLECERSIEALVWSFNDQHCGLIIHAIVRLLQGLHLQRQLLVEIDRVEKPSQELLIYKLILE